MPIEIKMPALSPTMTEGKIVSWTKKEGEKVNPGDILVEIETDKAIMEMDSAFKGQLGKITHLASQDMVSVGEVIGYILKDGETLSDIENLIANKKIENVPTSQIKAEEQQLCQNNKIEPLDLNTNNQLNKDSRVYISPLAKKIAIQNNIDINNQSINGTGPRNRIVKEDIMKFIENFGKNTHNKIQNAVRNNKEFEKVDISGMRKVIAKRLIESKNNIPHFYISLDLIMDSLVEMRELINERYKNDNIKISINDLFIKIVSIAIKENPKINSSWQGDSILKYNNIDISVAVAIQDGLITPVIKNADFKSIFEISNEMKDLAKRAREGKLSPSEYQGGGLTISNMGGFAIPRFQAIINPPQSCIVAIGSTTKQPVINGDNQITVKSVCNITLSGDHRVLDGKDLADFANSIRTITENPFLIFI